MPWFSGRYLRLLFNIIYIVSNKAEGKSSYAPVHSNWPARGFGTCLPGPGPVAGSPYTAFTSALSCGRNDDAGLCHDIRLGAALSQVDVGYSGIFHGGRQIVEWRSVDHLIGKALVDDFAAVDAVQPAHHANHRIFIERYHFAALQCRALCRRIAIGNDLLAFRGLGCALPCASACGYSHSPYSLVGRPLQEYLKQKIQEYREDAEKMGVRIWRNRP